MKRKRRKENGGIIGNCCYREVPCLKGMKSIVILKLMRKIDVG